MQTSTISTDDGEGTTISTDDEGVTISTDDEEGATISTDDGEGTTISTDDEGATISTDDEEGATISSGAGSVFYIGTAFVMMFASAISFFLWSAKAMTLQKQSLYHHSINSWSFQPFINNYNFAKFIYLFTLSI